MAVDIRRLELERLENLVRNFGWETRETKHPPGEIEITLVKKLEGEEVTPPGEPA
jgi:hypothetical protein